MTKEERHREASRRYYEKNKERLNEKTKQRRLSNPEKYKEINNKATKKYYHNNKEYFSDYAKNRLQSLKDGYYKVYLLEDYNYVGVTGNITGRFYSHKYHNDRDCTNHRILYKTKDRGEALELEALLHDMGYEGRHLNNTYN